MAATPSGLPYPTPADYLWQSADWLTQLLDKAMALIANPGAKMSRAVYTADAAGDVWITVAGLTAVAGLVAQPLTAAADTWVVYTSVGNLNGNQVRVNCQAADKGSAGYQTRPYVGAITLMWYAWGTT